MKAYKQDLAYIHDIGFGGFAERAAPALRDILQRGGITDGLVVDLGCGAECGRNTAQNRICSPNRQGLRRSSIP